jgi:hypothetical protein
MKPFPTTHKKLLINLFLLLLCLIFTKAHAWGPLGHKALCDAAWRLSSQEIKTTLAETAKRMGYKTFADSCVWADEIRGNMRYDWVKPLHYVNLPRSAKSTQNAFCQKVNFLSSEKDKPDCVITAIEYFLIRSRDVSLGQRQRDEALLLMSHFVGDLHQPLHVAYKDDRGGTGTKVIFNGKAQSLHYLWDNEILYCGYRGSWRTLGKSLFRQRYKQKELDDGFELNLEIKRWADESLVLTRSIYANLEKRLPDTYCDLYHDLAIERLLLASHRLQSLLSRKTIKVNSHIAEDSSDENFLSLLERLLDSFIGSIFGSN